MKKYKSFVIGGVLCCFFALLAGCASSELADIWSDSSFQSPPLNKMLVISVSKNSAHRRIWEDAFSAELVKHNVAATPSYSLFPDAVPDTNQVIQIVQKNGFDGVLIIRRLPSEANPQYVQEYLTQEKDMRYIWRRDRFVTYYRRVAHAAYVDSQKVDIRSIDVWATKNEGQLIWCATSETPEPNSIQEARPEIVKLVMSELTKQGMIASGQ
ncbi:MAG: hypothetical protein ABR936_07345 [Bacteroidota bacterium]|jgi:hypothetical protein